MRSIYFLHATIVISASLLNWALAYWIWRRARDRTGYALLGVVMANALWMSSAAAEFFVPTASLKFQFALLAAACSWGVPFGWFVFSLYYTDRESLLTRPVWGMLIALVAANVGLILTSGYHELIFSNPILLTEPFPQLVLEQGPLWAPSTAIGFVLLGVGITAMLHTMVRSRRISRWQPLLLVVALLPNVFVYTAENYGYLPAPGFDYTSITWIGFAAIVGYTYFNTELLRISPVTRGEIMESVKEGIVVVDEDRRIVDYNETANDRFSLDGQTGTRLDDAVPVLIDEGNDDVGFADELTLISDDDTRVRLKVEASVMTNGSAVTGYALSIRDVTELHEQTESLKQQTEQLEQFASTVSHDLRNPLTVAAGYSMEIEDRIDSQGRVEDPELVDKIQVSLDRMETIIDDALALARSGRAIEDRTFESITSIVEASWRTCATGNATLELDCAAEVQLYTDRDRLQTLFENLFRNAVEHGSDSATVWVGLVEDGFYVEDDGPGIPESVRQTVFRSGYTTGGNGLGLAIVDQIVDAHGWEIRIEAGRDGGAKFVVTGIDIVDHSVRDTSDEDRDTLRVDSA